LAAIVKRDLAAIGIEVEVHQFASSVMPTKEATRGEPFDIGLNAYLPDYLDPASLLNVLLSGDTIVGQGNTNVSYFDDSVYNAKLAAAAKLTGHGRYRAYGRLDIDLARNAAPLIAYGVLTARELFSSRLGCQVFAPSVAGMDLAALCLRKKRDG
jgi:ABC-type oligopeptide transport system substrate-binding subunit